MKKIYFTEEERIAARKEYQKQWYQRNKEYFAKYRQANKEKIAEYQSEYQSEYYQNNKEKITEYQAEYRQANKEKIAEKKAECRSTPLGRANYLLDNYKRNDKKHNRGECIITADWIVEHIFSQPCHYCGKNGWKELGCDRIDNSLPHTPDNVVPCCAECNIKKMHKPYDEFINGGVDK